LCKKIQLCKNKFYQKSLFFRFLYEDDNDIYQYPTKHRKKFCVKINVIFIPTNKFNTSTITHYDCAQMIYLIKYLDIRLMFYQSKSKIFVKKIFCEYTPYYDLYFTSRKSKYFYKNILRIYPILRLILYQSIIEIFLQKYFENIPQRMTYAFSVGKISKQKTLNFYRFS
jgi:hypothetical protein